MKRSLLNLASVQLVLNLQRLSKEVLYLVYDLLTRLLLFAIELDGEDETADQSDAASDDATVSRSGEQLILIVDTLEEIEEKPCNQKDDQRHADHHLDGIEPLGTLQAQGSGHEVVGHESLILDVIDLIIEDDIADTEQHDRNNGPPRKMKDKDKDRKDDDDKGQENG